MEKYGEEKFVANSIKQKITMNISIFWMRFKGTMWSY